MDRGVLHIIRNEFKEKVGRDEFVTLENRVSRMGKAMRQSVDSTRAISKMGYVPSCLIRNVGKVSELPQNSVGESGSYSTRLGFRRERVFFEVCRIFTRPKQFVKV